jgi:signal transduction histidine kinase
MIAVFTAWLAIAAFTAEAAELRRRRADEEARHRVVEERLRIAREMHDVLSHSLATISIQSGAGLRLFEMHPEEAETALRTIRQVSNDALAQARAALATIRDPGDADSRPGPGLRDLDALFASVRAAGLVVQPSLDFGSGPVPYSVGSAAYRVVQESLTNVMRHAGAGARATVGVVCSPGALVIEVTDTGNGKARAPGPTTPGHGVTGMRERVLELGGEFSARPQPAGGFRVWARLPTEGPVR